MTSIRLHVISEGQTEEAFVKRILAPHLGGFNVFADARSVLTSRDKKAHKNYRGGLVSYLKAKADIETWMKEDGRAECRFTTMFDLYALPGDFPGYTDARRENDPCRKVKALENAMKEDIDDRRFIPYIQLHEFEALILSDAGKLDWEYLDHDAPIRRLVEMAGNQNPELIDDTPEGAPSKRILRELPEYDKANSGVLVAEKIGLQSMKAKCSHFRTWVELLEGLAKAR
jgi:hypothetical protein